MPSNSSIPDRYPVLEHMEARQRQQRAVELRALRPPPLVPVVARYQALCWTGVALIVGYLFGHAG